MINNISMVKIIDMIGMVKMTKMVKIIKIIKVIKVIELMNIMWSIKMKFCIDYKDEYNEHLVKLDSDKRDQSNKINDNKPDF